MNKPLSTTHSSLTDELRSGKFVELRCFILRKEINKLGLNLVEYKFEVRVVGLVFIFPTVPPLAFQLRRY